MLLGRLDFLALTLFASLAVSANASEPTETALVRDFVLDDAKGNRHALYSDAGDAIGTVLAFTSVDCPIAKLYAPRLARLHQEYREEGIRFLGINPNFQDKPEEIRERATKVGVGFPILCDPLQVITRALEVTRTTEVLFLDENFRLLYRGALDDQYGLGTQKPHPHHEYLIEALEAHIAQEDIEVAETEAPGCLIGQALESDVLQVTYNEHIAPILQQECLDCHRSGQIGPMHFESYEDAASWAPMIAEVVEERRMPPWHADPRHGSFSNERRLSATQRAMLVNWVQSGSKEGEGLPPPPPTFPDEGWAIGEPDYIVQLEQDQKIPADGVVDYRYVIVDPKLEEDHWVQALEIRPTNTEATHHVLALAIPPGQNAQDLFRRGDDSFVGLGYFGVQVPGCRPNIFPEGMGKRLLAGTKFLFQLHYTPTGVPGTDRTRMALRWADGPVEHEVITRGIFNGRLRIPPGDPEATFHAKHSFEKPVRLLSMFPHMHTRGKAFRFELLGADVDKVLLDVPRYDFNWQNFYRLMQPQRIEPGEVLYVTAVYDNSTGNPFNPDPTATVYWGDQTFEEMMIGYIDFYEEVSGP
jgi:peroxiredoxin